MHKQTRIFTILSAVFLAFVMLSGTLAAARSATAAPEPLELAALPVGEETAVLAASSWDTQFGLPPGGNGVNGEVVAIAEDGNGNLYAGGLFNQAGGVTAYNIAMWDGSSWNALIDGNGYNGVSGDVLAIAIDPVSGDVYVGGRLARIDGTNAGPLACRLARWSPSSQTWSVMADSGGQVGVDGDVYALAVMGNYVYVGGLFDGAATTGSCGTLNVPAPGLARWHTGSGSWSDVGGSMGSLFPVVDALAAISPTLYVGGYFDKAGSASVANIAQWNGSSWSGLGSGLNSEVYALDMDAFGTLYAGGAFTQTGGINYIAQWNGSSWSPLGSGLGTVCLSARVNAIKTDSNEIYTRIYAAGTFQTASGVSANNIALWDGSAWSALDAGLGIQPSPPFCEMTDTVNGLGLLGTDLYAGGMFTTASGVDSYNFARWVASQSGLPDLTLVKDDGGMTAVPGDTVTYTLTYSNAGSGTANDVTISDTVPAYTVFNAAASSGGWSCADGAPAGAACSYSVGSLAAANGGVVTFGVTISSFLPSNVTMITNTASISDSAGTPTLSTDTTPLLKNADLSISKTDNLTTVYPGDTLIYTITVTNNGDQDALNVAMADVLPPGVGFVAANGGGVYSPTIHSVIWPAFGVAAYGGFNQVTVEGTVTGPFTQTTALITNTAIISEPTSVQTAVDTDTVQSLALGNLVWDDSDGDGLYEPANGEQGIPEVILNLYQDIDQNNQFSPITDTFIISVSTDSGGLYTFTTLIPGDYIVQVDPINFNASFNPLYNRVSSNGNGVPAPDPDNDLNDDDNGDDVSGQGAVAQAVTLSYGGEPTNDGDGDANSNLSVDFGFAQGGIISGRKFEDMDGDGLPGRFNIDAQNSESDGMPFILHDLDGDGDLDLVANVTEGIDKNWLEVFINTGYGVLTDSVVYNVRDPIIILTQGRAFGVGDMDEDGNPDIVYDASDDRGYELYLGVGNGQFISPTVWMQASGALQPLYLADVNGSYLDLISTNSYNNQLNIYLGNGNGTLSADTPISLTNLSVQEMTTADLGSDSDVDVVGIAYAGGVFSETLFALTNDGLGSFTLITKTYGSGGFDRLALGYINNDSYLDLAVLAYQDHVSVMFGDGAGGFGAETDYPVSNKAVALALEDVNGDGKDDLITGNDIDETVSVYLNNGSGGFGSGTDFETGLTTVANIALADITQDGALDIIASGTGKNINPSNGFLLGGLAILPGRGDGTFADQPEGATQGGTWTIYLDSDNDGVLDAGEITTTTNISGQYAFAGLAPDAYIVQEVTRTGWIQTYPIDPAYHAITLTSGAYVGGVNFGNFKTISVSGVKYEDMNANGLFDGSDQPLSGEYIFLDANNNGVRDSGEVSATTDAAGYYAFTNLGTGVYTVTQEVTAGWTAVTVTVSFIAASGQDQTINFGSSQSVAVGDKVWLDWNADGVQDTGEPGVQGVPVTLNTAAGQSLMSQTTNISGTYTFANVTPGQYIISFTLPSGYLFSPRDQATFDFMDSDADVVTGATAVFTLTSGADQPTWDAGMYRPATLGDRVWNDANYDGRQDAGENGMSGVTVTLYISGSNTPLKTTSTNSNGDYSFSAAPGDYWLKFARPSGYIFTQPDVAAEDVDSDVDAGGNTLPFPLAENENNLDWDAGVVELAAVGNRVWYDVDGDGIQDGEEPGKPGITVTLRNGTGVVDTLFTNGDGYYTFTNVIPGNYYIKVEKPAGWEYSPFQNPAAPDNDSDSDVDETSGGTGYFTLNPGQVDKTQDAGMYPLPATIGDRVWHDLDGDGIQDAGEPGLAGATVGLYFVGNTFPLDSKTTDANGYYTFTNVLPGDYFLSFSPPGGYYLSPRDQGGDDALDSDADPTSSSPTFAETISFTVSAGAVMTTWDAGAYQPPILLGGQVWFELDYNGIRAVTETFRLSGITVTLLSGNFVVSTTRTNANGYYTFTNLVPGTYALKFPPSLKKRNLDALSPQDQGNDDTIDSDPDPVTGQTVTFTLSAGQQITTWDAGYTTLDTIYMFVNQDNNLDGIVDGSPTNVKVHLWDINNNKIQETELTNNGLAIFIGWWDGIYLLEIEKPAGFLFVPKYLNPGINPATGKTDPFTSTISHNSVTTWSFGGRLYQPGSSGNVWPGSGSMVQFVDGQSNVTLAQFQAGAVTTDTTMYLTNLASGSAARTFQQTGTITPTFEPPDGYTTTNHHFYLDAEQGGRQTPGLTFTVPATLTIEYSDADVAGVNEDSLRLFYWDGDGAVWVEAATVCATSFTPQLDTETNRFTAEVCQIGQYALFGQTSFTVYLPVVIRP